MMNVKDDLMIIFDNYEEIRNHLIKLYDEYFKLQDTFDKLFLPEIEEQFVAAAQSYVTNYIAHRSVMSTEEIKIRVEHVFDLKHILVIVSEEGGI